MWEGGIMTLKVSKDFRNGMRMGSTLSGQKRSSTYPLHQNGETVVEAWRDTGKHIEKAIQNATKKTRKF